MNRSRLSLFDKLRKQMGKAVKKARSLVLSDASQKDCDSMTAKELQKKFPHKPPKIVKKTRPAKKGKTSKRTSPGEVEGQSSPGYAHREGKRWIKNGTKKMQDQRKIAAHHGKG